MFTCAYLPDRFFSNGLSYYFELFVCSDPVTVQLSAYLSVLIFPSISQPFTLQMAHLVIDGRAVLCDLSSQCVKCDVIFFFIFSLNLIVHP